MDMCGFQKYGSSRSYALLALRLKPRLSQHRWSRTSSESDQEYHWILAQEKPCTLFDLITSFYRHAHWSSERERFCQWSWLWYNLPLISKDFSGLKLLTDSTRRAWVTDNRQLLSASLSRWAWDASISPASNDVYTVNENIKGFKRTWSRSILSVGLC